MKIANATTATHGEHDDLLELNQSRSLPLSSITCIEPTQITSSPSPTLSIGTRARCASRACG